MELIDRFNDKYIPEPNTGCWLWSAGVSSRGYGAFAVGYAMKRAHRVAYELFRGEIPDGMHVCHKCDQPTCVNPDHLFLGTNADNVADKVSKGRQAQGRGKLTEHQVRAIRADTRTHEEIAAEYGIHQGHVCKIQQRLVWKHIN